jgi:predicted metalloprotease with PDZ domain
MIDRIHYTVSAPHPSNHLFHVRMAIASSGPPGELELAMPVWTPGSYLVREYGRHVQGLCVFDAEGNPLAHRKLDKARWLIEAGQASGLVVEYDVFAHDLTVRTNHLDDSHGFFNGTALYLYPPSAMDAKISVTIEPPRGWRVHSGFGPTWEGQYTFEVADFDLLFDTPVEMGAEHDVFDFEALGKPHRVVVWGRGLYDREAWRRDFARIVEANAAMFGDELPYERYLFIVHLTDNGYGGLEHLNSTVLLYARHKLQGSLKPNGSADEQTIDEPYADFLRLVCHEHFHVWHVKRIRPAVLGPFDYQNENYTRELWSIEGVTSYYDTYNLLRAGVIDSKDFLKRLAERIKQLDSVPGRSLHSLEDASFDAWIKLYRPDENTLNSSVSYYLKGELVACLLDLWIRRQTDGARGLDAVMTRLWQAFRERPEVGYEEGAFEPLTAQVVGMTEADGARGFFARFVSGTVDADWNEFLEPMGLQLVREHENAGPRPWLGLVTKGETEVSFVTAGGPAYRAGIYAGDELVALDGWKVTGANLQELLGKYAPGQEVTVHLFRRGELRTIEVTLGATPPGKYTISVIDGAGDKARALRQGWLGADVSSARD